MIKTPTVFVLGAGERMPYGFPSGNQLVKEILGSTAGIHFEDQTPGLLSKGEIIQVFQNAFDPTFVEKFEMAFHYSQ